MPTISHRELRNSSAEVLRRVAAGETFEITNHGEIVAVLSPAVGSQYERLVAAGKVRAADGGGVDLRKIKRGCTTTTTADIIFDVRGDW